MKGIFFRIENDKGQGPYLNEIVNKWKTESHDNNSEHPTPYYDSWIDGVKFKDMEGRICGFKSLTQLEAWFTSQELSSLSKLGFHVETIEGQDATIFEHQVIFNKVNYI